MNYTQDDLFTILKRMHVQAKVRSLAISICSLLNDGYEIEKITVDDILNLKKEDGTARFSDTSKPVMKTNFFQTGIFDTNGVLNNEFLLTFAEHFEEAENISKQRKKIEEYDQMKLEAASHIEEKTISNAINKYLISKKVFSRIKKLQEQNKSNLVIDWEEFTDFGIEQFEVGVNLTQKPNRYIPLFNKQLDKITLSTNVSEDTKNDIEVKFSNLPDHLQVNEIRTEKLNELFSVSGNVVRIGDITPKLKTACFTCPYCGESERNRKKQDIYSDKILPIKSCVSCDRSLKSEHVNLENSDYIDFQRIEIQNHLETLKQGEQPRRLEVWLSGSELCGKINIGANVTIDGILCITKHKNQSVYPKFFYAHSFKLIGHGSEIILSDERIEEIKELSKKKNLFDFFVNSFATNVLGYDEIKLALILQAFGGTTKPYFRDFIHILVFGDPGVAKSVLVRRAEDITPKWLFVCAATSTAVGLSVVSEQDSYNDGKHTTRGGALVMANEGTLGIDEIDKIKDPKSYDALNESMEQGTISTAKAGIVTKFIARTAIAATANPKGGNFKNREFPLEELDLPSQIKSRFDLKFPIYDEPDKERDAAIMKHILTEREEQDLQLIKDYISYAKQNFHPKIPEEKKATIIEYYVGLRQGSMNEEGTVKSIPIGTREGMAVIRLAEASAKARLKNRVANEDIERAKKIVNYSIRSTCMDDEEHIDMSSTYGIKPAKMRDKILYIEQLVRDLVMASDENLADLIDIYQGASAKNIDNYEVDKILNNLKTQGIVFEPKSAKFKPTIG